jgi:hypothetical protein
MVLVVGVISSLIGAAVWAIIAYFIEMQRQRSGVAAGDWYQITYDPQDTGKVWSVEWVEAFQRNDTITGTMWRIYPEHFNRRWKFQGRCHDRKIRAQYWATRGNGGEGSMKIHMLRPSNYLGSFEEEVVNSFQIGPSFVDFAAPVEWIGVQSDDEPVVLAELRKVSEADMIAYLPGRICRRLHDRLSQDPRSQKIFRALAFGACLYDLSGPLANEVERLRRIGPDAVQPSQPTQPSSDS